MTDPTRSVRARHSDAPEGHAFVYYTSCVDSGDGPGISDMVDEAREITWRTFNRYVPLALTRGLFPFYRYGTEQRNAAGEVVAPLHIKDDYAVRFYRGHYRGERCVFVVHSAIEYVFVSPESAGRLEASRERRRQRRTGAPDRSL